MNTQVLRIDGFVFLPHALDRWNQRSIKLGLSNSINVLFDIFRKARPDRPNPTGQKHLDQRQQKYGDTLYLFSKGWRFVVDPKGNKVVTVERARPCEN